MTGTSISKRRRTAVRIRSGTRMAASAARRCASSAARRLLQRSTKYCALAAPQCDVSTCLCTPDLHPGPRQAPPLHAALLCTGLQITCSPVQVICTGLQVNISQPRLLLDLAQTLS